MVGGAHPVVSSQQLSSFVTNDCNLNDYKLWILTGPNMGGVLDVDLCPTMGGVLKNGEIH